PTRRGRRRAHASRRGRRARRGRLLHRPRDPRADERHRRVEQLAARCSMSSANPTMYELVEDHRALEDLLVQEEEGTLEDADVVAAWLEELEGKLEDKADRVAAVIRVLDDRCAIREAEAHRLEALAKTDARARDRLKARL